jgi:hypothetical protein
MADDDKPEQGARNALALAYANALRGPRVLYHYCSSDAFVSIVTKRAIRLSSLSLSNDSREGRLVGETVVRLAERDGLGTQSGWGSLGIKTDVNRLRDSLSFLERIFDGLGFCLSEQGDVLSQWRGYADDARGVSIGFNRPYLEKLSASSLGAFGQGFTLHRVVYDPATHEAQVEPTYKELRNLIDAGAYKNPGKRTLLDGRSDEEVAADDTKIKDANAALLVKLLGLYPMLHELKSKAFEEEKEWRLVSVYLTGASGSVTHPELEYRARGATVVPYRDYVLNEIADHPAITEIVLGPRHATPPDIIRAMLKQLGFGDVAVRKSAASYR